MRLPLLFLGALAIARPVSAQTPPPERRLGAMDAEFPGTFSQIRGLRERSDGRVLVSDWIEDEVLLLDFGTRQRTRLGRSGRGPLEYRLPTRLIALPGDTTLLWDQGNQRIQTIGPDNRMLGTVPPPAGRSFAIAPSWADGRGNLYFVTPNWASGDRRGDSLRLNRWDRRTGAVEQIGRLLNNAPFPPTDGPRLTPTWPEVIFSPADGWVATPNGEVRFVRAGTYAIETRQLDGTITRGPSNLYPTRAVTATDRTWMMRRILSSSPTSGRGPDGGLGRGEPVTDEQVRQMVATNGFAERLPPFSAGGVWLLPTGELLVQRTTGLEPQVRLDRFDSAGRLVEQLVLPPGRQVAGVGRGTLYLIRLDDDELQHLERYRL